MILLTVIIIDSCLKGEKLNYRNLYIIPNPIQGYSTDSLAPLQASFPAFSLALPVKLFSKESNFSHLSLRHIHQKLQRYLLVEEKDQPAAPRRHLSKIPKFLIISIIMNFILMFIPSK